jgi:hypothetical protein
MSSTISFANPDNIALARTAVRRTGVTLFPSVVDPAVCRAIIDAMNTEPIAQRTEVNYGGSELRIWDAQRHHELLARFAEECDQFVSGMEQKPTKAYTLLAIRNRPIAGLEPSLSRGRWHIDSFRRQLKVFLFLSDTSEATGPFEFIPNTHRQLFKLQMLMKGAYISPTDLLRGGRSYSKLQESLIEQFVQKGATPTPVICKAGTVMVIDTSAIHRARPCLEGERYALTAYFH